MTASKSGAWIVKSSGSVEPFDPNVITTECVEAGIDFWTAAEVALEVSKSIHNGISTEDIQRNTLELLYKRSPEIAERYRRFHSMHVRTSGNVIEAYDRRKISDSLIKETSLPKEVAVQISKEAENELRRLKLDFISGPLIREVVNVKLLEHGYEEARADYTRLGMPVYDATQLIESGPKETVSLVRSPKIVHKLIADNVFREYALLKILPLHLADSHMGGELHINDLEHFVTRPYCGQHDLRLFLRNGLKFYGAGGYATTAAPAKDGATAILHAAKLLAMTQTYFSGTQCLDFFNVWLSPYMEGLAYDQIKKIAGIFVNDVVQTNAVVSSMTGYSGINIDYGVPTIVSDIPAVLPGGKVKEGVTYGDFDEGARLLSRALTEICLEGDHIGKPFFSLKPNYNLRKEDLKKDGYEEFMLNVHELVAKSGTPYFVNFYADFMQDSTLTQFCGLVSRSDSDDFQDLLNGKMRNSCLQVVTLNLPRIAYEANGDDAKLFEILDDRINLAREVMMIKRDCIRSRLEQGLLPFLVHDTGEEPYFNLDRAFHLIGYIGVNEMVKAHTDNELHESDDAWKFGLEVIKHLHETTKRWSRDTGLKWALSQIQDDSIAHRLAKLDYGQFSKRSVVKGNPVSGWVYYTNPQCVSKDAAVLLMERLKIEETFHPLSMGGMSVHINIGGVEQRTTALWDLTRRIAKDTSVGYWTYTKDMTHCKECGKMAAGFLNNCPNCGSTSIDHYAKLGDNYRRVSEWDESKKRELNNRNTIHLGRNKD